MFIRRGNLLSSQAEEKSIGVSRKGASINQKEKEQTVVGEMGDVNILTERGKGRFGESVSFNKNQKAPNNHSSRA